MNWLKNIVNYIKSKKRLNFMNQNRFRIFYPSQIDVKDFVVGLNKPYEPSKVYFIRGKPLTALCAPMISGEMKPAHVFELNPRNIQLTEPPKNLIRRMFEKEDLQYFDEIVLAGNSDKPLLLEVVSTLEEENLVKVARKLRRDYSGFVYRADYPIVNGVSERQDGFMFSLLGPSQSVNDIREKLKGLFGERFAISIESEAGQTLDAI